MLKRCSVGYSKGTQDKKMKFERERLVPWLIQKVNSGKVPGLRWMNREKTKFRVTWKHAGKPDFDLDKDAVLFRMWAEHTGKYKPGEQPDPSTWKTRFRCALRKMLDIEEIRVHHSLDDKEPYRVFQLKSKALKSVPKSEASIASWITDTPTPSPTSDAAEGLSSLPSFPTPNNFDQQGYGTMANNTADIFAFPSPSSSHTSSPTHSPQINSNVISDEEDSIDNITPTLPSLTSQQLMPNDSGMMSSSFENGFYYPGFYATVNGEYSHSELKVNGYGYGGGGSGAGMYQEIPYNGMTNRNWNPSQRSAFAAQNDDGLHSRMCQFLKMLEGAATSMDNEVFMENTASMDNGISNAVQEMTRELQILHAISTSSPQGMVLNDMHKQTTECHLSARIFYDKKEVTSFDLNKQKNIWRLFYGKQILPEDSLAVYSELYGSGKIKQTQLPVIQCSNDTQRVLTNFNRGMVLEITNDGDIWVTRKSLTKIFFSCGAKEATKLIREVKTKVFDFNAFQNTLQESQNGNFLPPGYDVTLTLGWPNAATVCIVITHAQAKKMMVDRQNGEQCITEPSSDDQIILDLANQLVLNDLRLNQDFNRQY